jgi:putative FmdB family regulatory protein
MPIYEFICSHCKRRFKKLVGVVANPSPLQCPHCSSTEINRQISRFARVRSEDDALDSIADDVENMGDMDDPKAMRRMMREMSSAMGEDMDDEIEQLMEEEAGGGTEEGD